jgi:hypothetical protein
MTMSETEAAMTYKWNEAKIQVGSSSGAPSVHNCYLVPYADPTYVPICPVGLQAQRVFYEASQALGEYQAKVSREIETAMYREVRRRSKADWGGQSARFARAYLVFFFLPYLNPTVLRVVLFLFARPSFSRSGRAP